MKQYKIVSSLIAVLLISTIGVSAGLIDHTDTNEYSLNDEIAKIPMKPLVSYRRDVQTKSIQNDFLKVPVDIPITNATDDESNPNVAIDKEGNPLVIFDKNFDFSQSALGVFYSPNRGETWPDEYHGEFSIEESYMTNPKITMLSDGIAAIGSYNDPIAPTPDESFFIAEDAKDFETWEFRYWDNSATSQYILETSSTVAKDDVLCFATISDYDTGDTYFIDTISMHWHLYQDMEFIGGVIFYNTDTNGISQPLSHLTSDAGEKVYFCAEQEKADGSHIIKAYYCDVDETTVYSDWRSASVAGGHGNCTYPDVAVSGGLAYCVYMDDRNGNQDIYVATTTSGGFWRKYVVVESEEDEMYPVITANGDQATCMFIKNNDVYITTSEDAGKTWSDPIRINDDIGSVVEEYGSIDISGSYGVWTSDINGNKDIFFEEVGKSAKVIIDKISGGFGVTAALTNIGNADAEDADWSITIDGALVFLGSETSGTISIPTEASATISTGFIFAIGEVTITVTVGPETKTVTGFALGPFILNLA